MKVGSQITVRAYDLSGRLARVRPVTVERVVDGGVVVYSQAERVVEGAKGGWNSLKTPGPTTGWTGGLTSSSSMNPAGPTTVSTSILQARRGSTKAASPTPTTSSTSSNPPAGTPGWSMWTSFTRPWSGMGFRQSFRPHVSGRWRRRFKCWLGGTWLMRLRRAQE